MDCPFCEKAMKIYHIKYDYYFYCSKCGHEEELHMHKDHLIQEGD
jgi:DNA-directed RNA polymerase subunit M/transcription elongation factor TFIIS